MLGLLFINVLGSSLLYLVQPGHNVAVYIGCLLLETAGYIVPKTEPNFSTFTLDVL